ncbi:MAG: DUF1194 domain-containing protein [Pseudomonadota bacterium]
MILAGSLAVSGTAAKACDLALSFAVDVSSSIGEDEFRIQMDGLAAGLRDPVVSDALVRSQAALMLMQWSGSGAQEISLPWRQVQSAGDVEALAQSIELIKRSSQGSPTAIGEALLAAARAFDAAPDCSRRVLDLSGDGVSNEGRMPRYQQAALESADITVNALVIETQFPGLTTYYEDNVISGQQSFAVRAESFADYPIRMREKLYREVVFEMANWPDLIERRVIQ